MWQDTEQQGQSGLPSQEAQRPGQALLSLLPTFHKQGEDRQPRPGQVCPDCRAGEEVRVPGLWQTVQGSGQPTAAQGYT